MTIPVSTDIVPRKTLDWVRQNSLMGDCMVVSSRQFHPYPEVTGYFIPTLYRFGEHELAGNYARWLARNQQPDGSFLAPRCRTPFAFDTGQVVRGLVRALPDLPELEQPAARACDWIISQSTWEGRLPVPANIFRWSLLEHRGTINEGIHLYVLPAIRQAGKVLGQKRYLDFADRSRDYYLKNLQFSDFRQRNMLSHFFLYIQEALCELDAADLARQGMKSIEPFEAEDGAIPAFADASWICSPGQAQASVVWFRLGEFERAGRALGYLERLTSASGGIPGAFGKGAHYFPQEEISWAVKYFLDAKFLKAAHEAGSKFSPSLAELDSQQLDRTVDQVQGGEADRFAKHPSASQLAARMEFLEDQIQKLIAWSKASDNDYARIDEMRQNLEEQLRQVHATSTWKFTTLYRKKRDDSLILKAAHNLFVTMLKLDKRILKRIGDGQDQAGQTSSVKDR